MPSMAELKRIHTLITKALLAVYKADPSGTDYELDPVASLLDEASKTVSTLYFQLEQGEPAQGEPMF